MGNKIPKNKTVLTLSCIGLAAITSLFLNKKSREIMAFVFLDIPIPQDQHSAEWILQYQKQQYLSQSVRAEQLAQIIQVTKVQGDFLSLNTLMEIYEKVEELFSDEYKVMSLHYRKQRRPLLEKESCQYINKVLKDSRAMQQLREQRLELLCNKLSISTTQLGNSIAQLYNSGEFDQFLSFKESLSLKLHEKIQSSKRINQKTLKYIFCFKLELLKAIEQMPQNNFFIVLKQLEDITEKFTLISTFIEDQVFIKFGVEQEDIYKAIDPKHLSSEVQKLMIQYEKHMEQFLLMIQSPEGY